MKPKFLLLPAIALLIAIGWIRSGRAEISKLERESVLLKQSLAEHLAGQDESSAQAQSKDEIVDENAPLDWKNIVVQLQQMRKSGNLLEPRSIHLLRQRFEAMSTERLASALNEITTLGLSADAQQKLEEMLLLPLCDKDPELVLTVYFDRFTNGSSSSGQVMDSYLSTAIRKWTTINPAKATAWFDQQLAAERFETKSLEGKSTLRWQLEGMLIKTLNSIDPSAASARLAQLPMDECVTILTDYMGNHLKQADQLGIAEMIRKHLPEDEQVSALVELAARQVYFKGYCGGSEYLDKIKATPAERSASVLKTAERTIGTRSQNKRITQEDIENLSDWARIEAPSITDKVIGVAIAQTTSGNRKLEFAEAANLATHFFNISNNDDILVEFLSNIDRRGHEEDARSFAQKIKDPTRRAAIIDQLK